MLRFLVLVAMGLILGKSAFADATDGQGYVSVLASFLDADSNRGVDDGSYGGQLGIGFVLTPNWNVQANISRGTLDGVSGQKHSSLGVDIQRVFNRSENISPYLFLGAGNLEVDLTNGPRSDGTMYSAGAGVHANNLFGDSPISLNLEYRYRKDDALSRSMRDHIVSVGFQIPFGRSTPSMPIDTDADNDNDGIRDSLDQCPRTRAGATVNPVGCELDGDADGIANGADQCLNTPMGAVVDSRGCGLDGDRDGVSDGVDQCPSSRSGADVNAQGCEADSDNDGVLEGIDQCQSTTPGARVDTRGCEITDQIDLPSVEFETNSDDLRPGAQSSLDDAVETLSRYDELVVEVAGHTDSDGAEEYNLTLSQQRAEAVLRYLVANGVDQARLSAQGYGESDPVASNNTQAGKAQNRRVVLRILNQ